MSASTSKKRLKPGATTFLGCLRKFLTPNVWKQAHQAHDAFPHRPKRWDLHPLLFSLLLMTWCAGDTQSERFETARAFYVAMYPKDRRPGKDVTGFQDAVARLPLAVFRALALGLRMQLLVRFGVDLQVDGFVPLGCDGTRFRCPRTPQLAQRLGKGAQAEAPPYVWVTALVHVQLGLLWSWRIGKGDASERSHLARLVPTLPRLALVIADAGYQGYALLTSLAQSGVQFLVRVSSQTNLYSEDMTPLDAWSEGFVYWWTRDNQRDKQPPLRVRLIRVHCKSRKVDVWLVTNVMDSQRLPVELAAKFYRMRWENEGFFRTYKRTLNKVKLQSRKIRMIHREVEASLLAVQVLLAQGAYAILVLGRKTAVSSPRQVLLEIRRQIQGRLSPRQQGRCQQRLAKMERERRNRKTTKANPDYPGREEHKPPSPPNIRPLTEELKALMEPYLRAA